MRSEAVKNNSARTNIQLVEGSAGWLECGSGGPGGLQTPGHISFVDPNRYTQKSDESGEGSVWDRPQGGRKQPELWGGGGTLFPACLLYGITGLICPETGNEYRCPWGTGESSASGEGAGPYFDPTSTVRGGTGALMRPNVHFQGHNASRAEALSENRTEASHPPISCNN